MLELFYVGQADQRLEMLGQFGESLARMRVLLLGSHLNYNLEHYVHMNLVKHGCEVKFYGYKDKIGKLSNLIRIIITRSKAMRDLANLIWFNRINDEMKKVAKLFKPDLVLSIKGEAVKPCIIEYMKNELGAKTALWYPDDPRFFDSLVKHIAPSYDHVFTASKKSIPMYEEIGCENVHFLPFACEETVHRKVSLNEEEGKRYGTDVIFVGTYTKRRAEFIKALEKAGIKVGVYGPYWRYVKRGNNVNDGIYGSEMVKAFNASKIVLNIHIQEDLPYKVNMRTFEAAGSGAFLLTDRPNGLESFFEIGGEVIAYEDEKDLVELADYYLTLHENREEIATKAQERAYREHTYKDRVSSLLKAVGYL